MVSEELKRIARASGERGRVLAARVVVMLKLYRRDPVRYRFLQFEVEHLARRMLYHMRQAVIVGAVIARLEQKKRLPHD